MGRCTLQQMHLLLLLALSALAGEAAVTQLTGVARDGKGGALLVVDDGRALYVSGMPAWPDGVVGLRVRAEGRVASERYVPEARVDPDGAISQGTAPGSAPDDVLHASAWSLEGAGVGIEPGPWRVSIADGSGNHTQVWREPAATEIRWSYAPVTPERSSSGTYSGGEPGAGVVTEDQALALWAEVRRLQGDASARSEHREKGTGALTVATVTGEAKLIVRTEPFAVLAAWAEALRS